MAKAGRSYFPVRNSTVYVPSDIDADADDVHPVNEIVKAVTGRAVSQETIRRWRVQGAGGCKLNMVRVSGVWCTTRDAFVEFERMRSSNLELAEIDIATADLRPAHEVIAARIGKRISKGTLWRWVRVGCFGVRLPAVRIGGTLYTTNDAFASFVRAQHVDLERDANVEGESDG